MLTRARLGAVALLMVAGGLAACDTESSTVSRPTQPAVLTGADLPDLVGEAPSSIVAFKHVRRNGAATWVQIPVQVDERAVVPFGNQPGNNTTPGVTGTVYGSGSGGATALQYTDPNTFVGADPNPAFDANDELVFMVADAGGQPRSGDPSEPAGVVSGSGVAVRVQDPQAPEAAGWVYLFISGGALDPSAGQDYVDYDFALTSGDYRTTYRRAQGPNPETSSVATRSYRISFTDRWYEVDWQVGDSPPLLEGMKNVFPGGSCGRSNRTFADAEGAFVANIDGPVRAIRSYVGANSGPKTQRTHLMYQDREEIVTDLRVHAIPGILDIADWSEGAVGMTYRSSTTPGGVTIDGNAESVSTAVPDWEAVHGARGAVVMTTRLDSNVPGITAEWYWRDQRTASTVLCWGDNSYLGASGSSIAGTGGGGIANTDPAASPFYDLSGTRVVTFVPGELTDGDAVSAIAELLADDIDTPVSLTVTPHAP